jgi:hypothetical protein
MKINRLDSTDKIYYMRAILGVIAGLTIGAIIALVLHNQRYWE